MNSMNRLPRIATGPRAPAATPPAITSPVPTVGSSA